MLSLRNRRTKHIIREGGTAGARVFRGGQRLHVVVHDGVKLGIVHVCCWKNRFVRPDRGESGLVFLVSQLLIENMHATSDGGSPQERGVAQRCQSSLCYAIMYARNSMRPRRVLIIPCCTTIPVSCTRRACVPPCMRSSNRDTDPIHRFITFTASLQYERLLGRTQ